jgi:phage terminase large subunit-like protein
MAREADRKSHQGRQYALIGFDELTHFTAAQFWYLLSRNRTTIGGFRPYVRATCNPDPDSFVADLVEWWIDADGYPIPERSGVVRWLVRDDDEGLHWYDTREAALEAHPQRPALSFTFIASRLKDNPKLLDADPSYRTKLLNMDRVTRARLIGDEERGGNWRVRAAAGLVFRRSEFKIADAPPSRIVRTVRAWDVASLPPSVENPDPDWTRGARVSLLESGDIWIDDLVSTRTRSAITLKLIRRTAAGPEGPELERLIERRGRVPEALEGDGPSTWVGLWQDPGGAGVIAVDTIRDKLAGFAVETRYTSRDKLAFAKAWSPLVEQGRVYLKRAPWNRVLLAECDAFPEGGHDDVVDAVSLAIQILLGSGLGFWDSLAEGARQLTEGR